MTDSEASSRARDVAAEMEAGRRSLRDGVRDLARLARALEFPGALRVFIGHADAYDLAARGRIPLSELEAEIRKDLRALLDEAAGGAA
ncbi:MAG: hypothetical protein L0216_13090 [Planctomycetales bacterium]|nr:hypothetical protein [Planctomycetales bacterium]